MTAGVRPNALEIDDLSLSYVIRGVPRAILRGVSLEIREGEAYGLVGESGCGKSTTAYAVAKYLPPNAVITSGRIRVSREDVVPMSGSQLRQLRLRHVSMVYQEPAAALNPTMKVGPQVEEAYAALGDDRPTARLKAFAALRRTQIADPERVFGQFPHQLSGGMQQRIVIAIALASDPALLMLDEPTTALDATVEASVLDLVRRLQRESGTSVLFISHNLEVIRSVCTRVGVMYAGRIVEEAPAAELFDRPRHPYTVGLLRSLPRKGMRKGIRPLATIPGSLPTIGARLPACAFADRCPLATAICREVDPPAVDVAPGHVTHCHHFDKVDEIIAAPLSAAPATRIAEDVVLEVANVSKTFWQGREAVRVLSGIDLSIRAGETLGLVGESGSGKTTFGNLILGTLRPDDGGRIRLRGRELPPTASQRTMRDKQAIQVVFQSPDTALNRSWTARRIIARAVVKLARLRGAAGRRRVDVLADNVRLSQRHLDLRPRRLSGGLKQRVAIARAFSGTPELVVADEPTSALDVSVQAAILNLLATLQAQSGTSYLLISHDLNVVRYLADRIAVMYLGRIMELGASETVFNGPNHPYTEALLSAAPNAAEAGRSRILLEGDIPSPARRPAGCAFNSRCHRAIRGLCEVTEPELVEVEPGHRIRCHIPVRELRAMQGLASRPESADAPEGLFSHGVSRDSAPRATRRQTPESASPGSPTDRPLR